MKRTVLLGTLLIALLVCALAISTPKPAHALLCCVGYYQTAQYWTKAPTCAEAQAAYRALARPEADDTCGGSTYVCAFSIPPCEDWTSEDPANPWKIDGVATFGCREDCGPIYP
ncbi:MAG TPA: hypothetical protein VGX68_15695 [Thermoanaerobaculia bacterium]|jgi:hypothetical protein|nr:hypothetical protein [Thermoanaerobaculia bacterium]